MAWDRGEQQADVVLGRAAQRGSPRGALIGREADLRCVGDFLDGLPAGGGALLVVGKSLAEQDADRLLVSHYPTLLPKIRRRLVADARGNPLALPADPLRRGRPLHRRAVPQRPLDGGPSGVGVSWDGHG